nr:Dynein regulatory complex subunit 2 [Polyrhizophydium stewartii]
MAKKGKKGKKGDKGAKNEFQSLKDEEARKRLLEEAKQKAKDRIALEERNFHLNNLKIQNRWREIMKAAKSEELRRQVEILRQVHNRHLDRKNSGIENLDHDLVEAEEQFSTALQAHLINIDTLIDLQNARLANLKSQFEADLSMLDAEFSSERLKLQSQHAKEKSDILGIMARAEHEFQESEADARHEYSSMKDDVKNKNLEEKHALRIQLEGTVEDLWRQFQSALNQYNSQTEERKRQFEELKQKDQKNAKEIEQQMKKLVKLQENIAHLKTKLSNNSKEYEERNKSLREEKETIQTQFQALKKRMNTFREQERQRLTDLTILSNNVLKVLREKVEVAEDIIKLAEMNRKLETEIERVIPFYNESNSMEIEQAVQVQLDHELPQEFDAMQQFNKRINKVMLDRLALEKQRVQLQEENDHLRSILKQYLDGISLSENVLAQLNPLIVVNGRTNAPIRHGGPLNVTFVEAAHAKIMA